jgi:alkaline phosphatase D
MRFCLTLLFSCVLLLCNAQLVAGPMLGQLELRTASIWLEVAPVVKTVALRYGVRGAPQKTQAYKGVLCKEFNPLRIDLGGLEPNTTYDYTIIIDGKTLPGGSFTTKELWQWRKPAPDFSFLTGSCNYVNNPAYDRPGKPYGADSSIFQAMAKDKSAFMLWLGDNWYTREVDYASPWGLWARASRDRSQPVLQPFLKAMAHYANWDDHDYGPNDVGGNYILKDEARKVFQSYWANPSYGMKGEGIYTQFSWSDVDFFVTDDRWWRAADNLPDSVDGKPNPEKTFLGKEQLQWLKNALAYSSATFKIIVVGSQVLNPVLDNESLHDYPKEYNELMHFIASNKIKGVLFLSGDHHHSEIIKINRSGTYPLYDITVSPLTSGLRAFAGPEVANPYRVTGFDHIQNFGRFSFSGPAGQRKLTVSFHDPKGNQILEWQIGENELK